jgi:hypothetical protein
MNDTQTSSPAGLEACEFKGSEETLIYLNRLMTVLTEEEAPWPRLF